VIPVWVSRLTDVRRKARLIDGNHCLPKRLRKIYWFDCSGQDFHLKPDLQFERSLQKNTIVIWSTPRNQVQLREHLILCEINEACEIGEAISNDPVCVGTQQKVKSTQAVSSSLRVSDTPHYIELVTLKGQVQRLQARLTPR